MSAFERTPQDIASRDRGLDAFAIVGVAPGAGMELQCGNVADLGHTVLVKNVCAFEHRKEAERSIADLAFAGSALLANVEASVLDCGA